MATRTRGITTMTTERRLGALLALAAFLLPAAASADLPPPDGTKFVDFQIEISGLAAHADHVLYVYPWSLSDGAPGSEVGQVEDGRALSFGRRIAGTPKVYAAKKDGFDPAAEGFDPEQGIDCGLAISPRFTVDEDGPDKIVERYQVAELSDTACRLQAATADPPAPKPDAPAPVATDAGGTGDAKATPQGGCAACSLGEPSEAAPASFLSLLLGLAALGRRRRR